MNDVLVFDGQRSDLKVDRKDTRINGGAGTLRVAPNHLFTYSATNWALSQLAKQLDIPWSYMRRCPAELGAHNFNHWLRSAKAKEIKLCMRGQKVIGIVSNRFHAYPIKAFLHDAVGACADIESSVVDYHLNDECLDLKVTFPDLTMWSSTAPRRKIGMGIHLRNSEVGYSAALATATIHDYLHGYGLNIGNERILKCSFARMVHVAGESNGKDKTDKFVRGVASLIESIKNNYKRILDLYMTTSNYTITVKDIRSMVKEFGLAKKILQGKMGIDIFAEETVDDTTVNMRAFLDCIAKGAAELSYPHRLDVERIGGAILGRMANLIW